MTESDVLKLLEAKPKTSEEIWFDYQEYGREYNSKLTKDAQKLKQFMLTAKWDNHKDVIAVIEPMQNRIRELESKAKADKINIIALLKVAENHHKQLDELRRLCKAYPMLDMTKAIDEDCWVDLANRRTEWVEKVESVLNKKKET